MVTKESLNMLKKFYIFQAPLECDFNPCHAVENSVDPYQMASSEAS